mgnify:CR=1 FL=1
MEDTCTCINCEGESAYFNGVNFECPECDFEWDKGGNNFFANPYEDEEEDEGLNELMALKEPFFKLNHGKLYNCKIQTMNGGKVITENISIVPLAFEKDKNRLFVLIEGQKWYDEEPKAIADFSKMDFLTIWNDGIYGYFEDSLKMPITLLCATTAHGTLLDQSSILFDFVEVK